MSNSYNLLSWMVRIRSCLFTAEINGGLWNRAPVNVSNARANCASPPGNLSCRRMTHTYSLPAPCWDLTSRVARSIQTIKQPVTLGSRVPLCPVFSTLHGDQRLASFRGCRCGRIPEHALHPSHNLVTARVRGLVQIDDTGRDVALQIALQRRAAIGDRREMASPNVHCRTGKLAWDSS